MHFFSSAVLIFVFWSSIDCLGARAETVDVISVQEDLIWTGHYDGKVTGQMSEYTRDAVRAFQKSLGNSPSGQLKSEEQSRLRKDATAIKKEVGFVVIDDTVTGMQIGLPKNLAPLSRTTKWGVNWYGADDRINVDTLRFRGESNIQQLYEKLTSISGRVLRYSPFRGNWFVLEGEDKDGAQFYVRADSNGGEVRAFSVAYPKSFKQRGFPIAIAMAASFKPFPAGIASLPTPPPVSPFPQPTPQPASSPNPAPQNTQSPSVTAENISGREEPCFNGLGAGCK